MAGLPSARKAGRFRKIVAACGLDGLRIYSRGVHGGALSAISGQGSLPAYCSKDAARHEHGAAFYHRADESDQS